ncbi:MAG: SAM-dependent methyltransferase, partial [Armatimonadetes bacterium]|nr:SAM-dependent methyltransferase [Anaerolineae bacterium]
MTPPDEIFTQVKAALLDDSAFVRATFTGVQRGATHPWRRLVLRPVLLKNQRHLQFSWYDATQNTVKNYTGAALATAIDEALAVPFANITVQSTNGDLQVQFTKKGAPLLHQHKPSAAPPDLAHDRAKQTLLNAADAPPFLRAIGITT